MNSTVVSSSCYGVTEKVVLTLLGGVFVPFTSWIVYVVARHRLRLKDTLKSRAYLFYQVLAGVLLGQFMCHTWVGLGASPVDARFMFLFALLGCNVFHSAETIGRLWNTNSNYNGPLDDNQEEEEEKDLDREKMEEQTVDVTRHVNSDGFSHHHWNRLDKTKRKRKRKWMMALVFVIFAIISLMDGLVLVFRNPQGITQMSLTMFAFWLNGVSMTISVLGAMLHAKWHVREERRALLWSVLTLVWVVILVGSVVPVLVNMSVETAQSIISARPFLAFYGVASGCVLVLKQYYHNNRKMDNIGKRESFWGEVIFWLATAQAAVTGFWL
jgi:hypothetical protein